MNAGLLSVERQGRGRYFRLAGPSVAEALEALARISPPEPIRSLRQGTRAQAWPRSASAAPGARDRRGSLGQRWQFGRGYDTRMRQSPYDTP